MSLINPANTLNFKSTDNLFARVRKKLKSYNAAGLIDEGDFYYWIKEVIEKLGVSVYDEHQAIMSIEAFKAPLPDNFSYLYAAYKCTPSAVDNSSHNTLFPQTGFVFYTEETHEPFRKCKNCYAAKIDYVHGDKITIRTYIEGQPFVLNFTNPLLLRLSKNVKGMCHDESPNLSCRSQSEITLNKGFMHTNFDKDCVYIEYYGLAIDPESGLPMVPDNTFIEKCIEDYIIYQIIEALWFNGEAPDMDKRYQVAKANYEESLKSALYYVKLPAFQTIINKIRFDRKNLRVYQQTA
jgi:hypothetical protein